MMFSLCCPLYGLELVPGKHCPVEEMLEFLRALPDCRDFPPLYRLPKYKSQNLLVLAWLLSRVRRTWLWRSGSRCTVSQFGFIFLPQLI